jgi:hypothetical protein
MCSPLDGTDPAAGVLLWRSDKRFDITEDDVKPTSRRAFLGTAGTMAAGVGVFGLTKVNDHDDRFTFT